MLILVSFTLWMGGKEDIGVIEDKNLIFVVIWLGQAESKSQ